jgi:hypothetical protein
MTKRELFVFVLAMISGTVSLILFFDFVIDRTAAPVVAPGVVQ